MHVKSLNMAIESAGTSLVVQWLTVHVPNAGDLGSIPGQGTRSHVLQVRVGMALEVSYLGKYAHPGADKMLFGRRGVSLKIDTPLFL